jgi:two-component system, LytTR family, sensor kinase
LVAIAALSAAISACHARVPSENVLAGKQPARGTGAHIAVRARRDGDRLRLEITDDGPGFTGPIWLPGHGLDGLRARLDALYGPAARLIVPTERAAGPGGAGVAIDLPAAREAGAE